MLTGEMPPPAAVEDEDPGAALAKKAKQLDDEKKAVEHLSHAKVRIITGQAVPFNKHDINDRRRAKGTSAFFASLVLDPTYQPDWNIDTACTDGKTVRYNQTCVAEYSIPEVIGLLVEEGLHTGFGHHVRFSLLKKQYGDDFSPKLANIAADLAILGLLKESGFDIPSECCLPGEGRFKDMPKGLAMEQYYEKLHKKRKKGEDDGDDGDGTGGDGDPQGEPRNGRGDVEAPRGPQSPAVDAKAMQEAKTALHKAYMESKKKGDLPGGMEQAVANLLKPKIDWRKQLPEFLNKHAKLDRSWARPSRRWAAQGMQMPSMSGVTLGHVAFCNDTSGSLDNDKARQRFRSEATGVLAAFRPTKVTVLHHDVAVQRVEEWIPGHGELPWHPKGGGGTSHIPVFRKVSELDEPVDLIICLTDMYSEFPSDPPDAPILWACTTAAKSPYGTTIRIE